ncbi:MAG: SdiA-regulated domain-containing protein [Desulfocapsaceae bacterium]|nr:SdiA-regulated domain-containing protein [Desulfocapsaceae bacterium]
MSLKDLSDDYYHSGSGNLLLLSDDSASVVEATANGKELGRLSLKESGDSGLRKDVPKAEGINHGCQRCFVHLRRTESPLYI